MPANIIKLSHADCDALLNMINELDESELTIEEQHAKETLQLIRGLQQQRHNNNVRTGIRPTRFRRAEANTPLSNNER
jgi:hypothetical protein